MEIIIVNVVIASLSCLLGFYIGKVKGVDAYHEHLLREGKIREK